MPRGSSAKREREYEELKDKFEKSGRYGARADEVAARIVNKQRSQYGETKRAVAPPEAVPDVTPLAGMPRILDDMTAAIEGASRRVWIETWIVRDDRLGHKLAAALAAARARGVQVRLLFDALGSKNMPDALFAHLRESGIDARAYRPLARHLVAIFPRDHAPNMLVDDVGYTGRSPCGDEWLPLPRAGRSGMTSVSASSAPPCARSTTCIIRLGDVTVISDLARDAASTSGWCSRAPAISPSSRAPRAASTLDGCAVDCASRRMGARSCTPRSQSSTTTGARSGRST